MNSAEDSPGLGVCAKPIPFGFMSLSGMINCHISSLGSLCAQLMLEDLCRQKFTAPEPDAPLSDSEKDRIRGWMKIATVVAQEFEWKAVHDRIEIIRARIDGRRGALTNGLLATEMRVLRETIDSGLKWQFIYRYPEAKAAVLKNWSEDWKSVGQSFPSALTDIRAGVDLWALGHSTACVFHFMRVLEHGLRALAKDAGKNFEFQNWQNIIDQIEAEVRSLGKSLPKGVEKTERLKFLSEAAKEFVYFKDGWRNHVAHGRGHYDEHQARSIMEHVKTFMTVLSSRLSEQ